MNIPAKIAPVKLPFPPDRLVPPKIVMVKTVKVNPGAILGIPINACEVLMTPTILAVKATRTYTIIFINVTFNPEIAAALSLDPTALIYLPREVW